MKCTRYFRGSLGLSLLAAVSYAKPSPTWAQPALSAPQNSISQPWRSRGATQVRPSVDTTPRLLNPNSSQPSPRQAAPRFAPLTPALPTPHLAPSLSLGVPLLPSAPPQALAHTTPPVFPLSVDLRITLSGASLRELPGRQASSNWTIATSPMRLTEVAAAINPPPRPQGPLVVLGYTVAPELLDAIETFDFRGDALLLRTRY
ncbi:hypothetical protein [Leptolyngbya sp. FACHB-261]|uniref:hypothetical protein n=1 Tax=Leptolyngbya sp. FACHB-261 TaxID=2692806 RepID=UPI001686FE0B|nr:hypothetical protein [Leptolyngbya sp. FACHB-261]MBD2100233.1 hypothetical protein [Leptolyngbya sp. FACHB-261]